MLICLDAGHGGRDSGAVNGSRYEKNDTLKLATILRASLLKKGLNVIMTRTDDSYSSLKERSDFANKNKADYFISLHRNAFTDGTAKGVENWIYAPSNKKTEDFAAVILGQIAKVGVSANRGVKKGNFHVTRETNMPACLLELGFISNAQDNQLFDKNLNSYADAISKAILDFLGIKDTSDEIINDGDCSDGAACKLYRVQIGAYKQRENADKIAKELLDKGYNAVVV